MQWPSNNDNIVLGQRENSAGKPNRPGKVHITGVKALSRLLQDQLAQKKKLLRQIVRARKWSLLSHDALDLVKKRALLTSTATRVKTAPMSPSLSPASLLSANV